MGSVRACVDGSKPLEFGGIVVDEMAPAVHLPAMVDAEFPVGFRRDDGASTSAIKVSAEPITVEVPVAQKSAESDALNPRRYADYVMPLARQQDEAHEVAQRIQWSSGALVDDRGGLFMWSIAC